MTVNRILELAKIEQECCKRNIDNECDRRCWNCDLVQEDNELMEFWNAIINHYEEVSK